MEYIHHRTDIQIHEPTVITIGKFDGYHSGHWLILEELIQKKKEGLSAVLFTFDMNPRTVIQGSAPQYVLTNREKRYLLEQSGVDYLIEYPFTKEMRELEPEEFLSMLVEEFSMKCMVAGTDFRFGKNRTGDISCLRNYGKAHGIEIIVLEKMQYQGDDISSTRIRESIQAGNIEEANTLLGYTYFLMDPVVHGRQLGRTMGVPTVNQIPPVGKLIPPLGVYVSQIMIDGTLYGGITSVGKNPTISDHNPVCVETNIFEFSREVYGMDLEVYFLKFLRSEEKFNSLKELQNQMEADIVQAKEYLVNHSCVPFPYIERKITPCPSCIT
jgi:riboflavin kinase/FMN adenylyltransferase